MNHINVKLDSVKICLKFKFTYWLNFIIYVIFNHGMYSEI
jgi:hypothetical protein